MRRMRTVVHYGNVQILKDICPDCEVYSFIIDNKFVYCDLVAEKIKPQKTVRAAETAGLRTPPATSKKAAFSTSKSTLFLLPVLWLGKHVVLLVRWDHMVPYSYRQTADGKAFVAACQICNGLKGSKMFDTVEEVIEFVQTKKQKHVKAYRSGLMRKRNV